MAKLKPLPPNDALATAAGDVDYFATDQHYHHLAARVLGGLSNDSGFVLATHDPPAEPLRLARAIRIAGNGIYAPVDIPCGPALTRDDLTRAARARIRKGPRPLIPLFIFDEADRLRDEQLEEIYETAVFHGSDVAGAILLARSAFLHRLERPTLRFLGDALRARYPFRHLSSEEVEPFIRHVIRPSDGTDLFPPEAIAAITDASGGDPILVDRYARQLLAKAGGKPGLSAGELRTAMGVPDSTRSDESSRLAGDAASPGADAKTGPASASEEAKRPSDSSDKPDRAAILASLKEISKELVGTADEAPPRTNNIALHPAMAKTPSEPQVVSATIGEPAPLPDRRPSRRWSIVLAVCLGYLALVGAAGVLVFGLGTQGRPIVSSLSAFLPTGWTEAADSLLHPFRSAPPEEAVAAIPAAAASKTVEPPRSPAPETPEAPVSPAAAPDESGANETARAPAAVEPSGIPAPEAPPPVAIAATAEVPPVPLRAQPAAAPAPAVAEPEAALAALAEMVPSPAPPPPLAIPPARPAAPRLSAAETAAIVARGDQFLATGDIASARLYYERAANAGDAHAALSVGRTFDPLFLAQVGVRGGRGDVAKAAAWYRRARERGVGEADRLLQDLLTRPPR